MRGIGAYVSPTVYFKAPRKRTNKLEKKSSDQLEYTNRRIEEQKAVLEDYDTRLKLQDKVIYELVHRIGNLEATVSEKNKVCEERGSCTGKPPSHEKEENDNEAIFVEKEAALQSIFIFFILNYVILIFVHFLRNKCNDTHYFAGKDSCTHAGIPQIYCCSWNNIFFGE